MNLTMTTGAVVVGVDGSPCSDTALAWAARYAAHRRRPLLVVCAAGIQHARSEPFGSSGAAEAVLATTRVVADEAVAAVRRLEPGLTVDTVVALHDAREALLHCSARASIVVVGTRGLGTVRRLFLGSVSQAVARHAECPVVVVRSPHDGEDIGPVVVGTDADPASAATLEFAFDLASTEGRQLVVVHSWFVLDGFVGVESSDQTSGHRADEERLLAESLAGYAEKYPDVTVARRLPDDGPTQALVTASRTASALVVGVHARTGLHRMASSVSRDVLEGAESTVVIVPL
jgi:nucleotide-binding universal stress UspA family protein